MEISTISRHRVAFFGIFRNSFMTPALPMLEADASRLTLSGAKGRI
jgi:hypothetical protein